MDFDFFIHPVCPYGRKEDLIVRHELHSSEKVILCNRDAAATDKPSDVSLEHDAIFDKPHPTTVGDFVIPIHQSITRDILKRYYLED